MNSKQEVADQYLFSYGTLQLPQVQLATFGRLLDGVADRLPGFSLSMLKITDPQVIATSGKTHHPIIAYSGVAADGVDGMALLLTPQELEQADRYEVADYQRQTVSLASGRQAWVYVAAGQAGQCQDRKVQ
ncbi:gamma-glutamylcyclotransferase family protein [Aquitalea sp.]|uniref:gamma-glutamylcyclotransferase family protein n=1 Tax=Aquitalea sp. TaxID=1872623 RepID=UPI00258B2AD7|nr:gamma-glutamylcyclotransferase family protein [Aquitalea sp.]